MSSEHEGHWRLAMAIIQAAILALEKGSSKERRQAARDIQEGQIDRWIAIVAGTNDEFDAIKDRITAMARDVLEGALRH